MKERKWSKGQVAVAVAVAVLSSAPGIFGQDCPQLVDTYPPIKLGAPWLVKIDGPYAYVALNRWNDEKASLLYSQCRDQALAIVDVSNPDRLRIVSLVEGELAPVGSIGCSDLQVLDFAVSDDHLFIFNGTTMLELIDVSDPLSPMRIPDFYRVELGGASPMGGLRGIEAEGDFVYVIGSHGLTIVDVSNIDEPAEAGLFETSWWPSDFEVAHDTVYVTDPDTGLRIIDVSDPKNPREIGAWETTWTATDISISGGMAYVADLAGGLRIFQIDDPSNPIERSQLSTIGEARKVSAGGILAAVALGYDGVSIVDVSDPSSPVVLNRYVPDESVWDISLHGETALMVTHVYPEIPPPGGEPYRDSGKLRIVDLSSPGAAVEIDSLSFESFVKDIAIDGGLFFQANGDIGFSIIEELSPRYPRQHTFVDTPGQAVGVTIYNDMAFVADEDGGLRIIDVSDASRPAELGAVDTPGQSRRVATSTDLAVVADGDAGIRIIDFSDPSRPEEIGSVDTPGQAVDVAISGDWAYVADGPGGLRVIDFTDPTEPREVPAKSYPLPGGTRCVEVSGHRLFVARSGRLDVLDISDPESPDSVGDYGFLHGVPTDIILSQSYAFVATRSEGESEIGGVDVFEISDPEHPIRAVGRWDFPGDATGIAASDGLVYVAGGERGIQILDTRCLASFWIELVAHQPGAHESEWRSDVIIGWRPSNGPSRAQTDIEVEFFLHTKDGVFTGDAVIPPFSSAVFEDIVGLLGYEGKGALEIHADAPIWVSSRIYNLTPSGTSGAYFPGYRSSDCLRARQGAMLYGLRQDRGRFRTNISVTNTSDEVQDVDVFLFGADGSLLHDYSLSIAPKSTVQDLQPFKNRAQRPNLGWGFAVVSTGPSSTGILASATVIDSRTNDSVVVPMN